MSALVPLPSIRTARQEIRSGAISAAELMQQCLEAIDRLDRRLNVFASLADPDSLLQQATSLDLRRQSGGELAFLDGIPIGLKDIYQSVDLPPTASSKVLAGYHPRRD